MYVGNSKGSFNGESLKIESPPIVVEGRTYIPLIVVAEQFGYKLISDNNSIILSRKVAEGEKETLRLWEEKRSYYRSIIYGIMSNKAEGHSIEEIPIQEARKAIPNEIKSIKAIIEKAETSSLIKVLGQEYISALKAADALYAVATSKKDTFEKAYNTAVYKLDYLGCEYKDLEDGRYSESLVTQDFTSPSYDEVRVSVGYTYLFKNLREMVEDVSNYYKEERVEMQEISFRISTASEQRENLKCMRSVLRSQDAKETFDVYIAYADLVITYYCNVR